MVIIGFYYLFENSKLKVICMLVNNVDNWKYKGSLVFMVLFN